ncbi:hypothetical protein Egran_03682, partial [Elaphomyces granulatus]
MGFTNILLSTGHARADSKDNVGQTPLCHAAKEGYKDVINVLLATEKVDPDSKDQEG